MKALIGKKIGMTQVYLEDGKAVPVTVLDVSGNIVSNHIKNGDVISYIEIGKDKKKNPNNAEFGNYKQLKFVPRFKQSVAVEGSEIVEVGTEIGANTFNEGESVTVSGISKGKGFQGVMKRWNFKGGKRTHGQSDRDRAPGSIGSGTTPGRVLKGKKMAGRIGREQKTRKHVPIISIIEKDNLIAIKGPVPGFNGSYVIIKSE